MCFPEAEDILCSVRQDLILHYPSKLLGGIVAAEQPEDCDEEDAEDATTTLTVGITENKNSANTDVIGQLLAGMEKLAGELAHDYI